METPDGGVVHPLAVGRIVRHVAQTWTGAVRLGTGTILRVMGPYAGGGYDYDVLTGADFDRMPGADNPRTHVAHWPGDDTIPIA